MATDYLLGRDEQQLIDSLGELDDLIEQYEQARQANEEEYMILCERVQGDLAEFEKRTADYEQSRDRIDQQRTDLGKLQAEAQETRDHIQMQLVTKYEAKLNVNPNGEAAKAAAAEEAKQRRGQADPIDPAPGMATKDQIEALQAQLSKPKPEPTLDPPGMQPSQASQIDKDLKLMAKIKAKEQKLDGASQDLKENWNQAKGPKP